VDPGTSIVAHTADREPGPWTADAMRAARPAPVPRPRAVAGAEAGPVTVGQPGSLAGSLPDGDSGPTEGDPADTADVGAHGGWTYPTPFDRYEVFPNYGAYPYRTVGKLFFTRIGIRFSCSAASIGGAAVWTAGHCVSDGAGELSSNVVFVPQRHKGSNPKGQFRCSRVLTTSEWHLAANLRRDMGIADNCRRADGRTVTQVVGSLGFAWNQPASDEHYVALGYPEEGEFTGETMQQCSSSYGHVDEQQVSGTGPLPFAIGCDQTGGASGGPWIENFGKLVGAQSNLLNGNVSYRYTSPDQPLELYSPYFDDAAKALYDAAQ
jgi:V8-like Glu-specific endopeptidase